MPKICALGSLKFVVTFSKEAQMEATLNNHKELDLSFTYIKRWNKYKSCDSRKVWLKIFGVPPREWSRENFKKIAEL